MSEVIKSVSNSQDEIFRWIMDLYSIKQFDLDPTYSRGVFYKNIPEPRLKFDLNPQVEGVKQSDCCNLPLSNASVSSIIFDPPFCFGVHGKTRDNISAKRFTVFESYSDLRQMYRKSLREFYRILQNKGVLVFKCQDYTDSKTTMTHCLVWQWAEEAGFYAKDLFIYVWTGGRIYNPKLTQRHARKFHSYFWILQKK